MLAALMTNMTTTTNNNNNGYRFRGVGTLRYASGPQRRAREMPMTQDSSKGGAVETGCSDLYAVIY